MKLGLEYESLYWIFCGLKHTLPMGAAGAINVRDDAIDVVQGPSSVGVHHAALHSANYMLRLCLLFQRAFGLSTIDVELKAMQVRLHEASAKVDREATNLQL